MEIRKELVKAEILWTRDCMLHCNYCAMVTNESVEKDWNRWAQGFRRLKTLGCDFAAVYGAEPLLDMKYLPEAFKLMEDLGMLNTLITSCVAPDVRGKLDLLYQNGLRSLTVSFDGEEGNVSHSKKKSESGLDHLLWFKKNYELRDAAVVFTVTKKNVDQVLDWIPRFAEQDIHVFMDWIHDDKGNPGTKCRNFPGIEKLMFSHDDKQTLVDFGEKLLELERDTKTGPYVHQSEHYIGMLINTPEVIINRSWNCAFSKVFPSWVTIENTGDVRVCDDFHLGAKVVEQIKFWELTPMEYDKLADRWRKIVQKSCKGCAWATHIDANLIKSGLVTFGDYVNNKF